MTPAEAAGPPRVFVHVGEPKTGTTFLQQVMWTNKDELLRAGLLVPGSRPLAHWRAAQDLREVEQIPNDPVGPHAGAWDKLARQALKAPRTAVISHELLAAADAAQAERGLRSLEPAQVHVVLTVRDFGTLLPAEWQETVKHRNTRDWEGWLSDVIDAESVAPDRRQYWFWRVHDTLEILRVWSGSLPPDRVHVITMPPSKSPPGLLWQRFAAVVGVDPAVVDTSRARRNASLGLADIELLRRVNRALPDEVPGWFYMRNVKDTLAHGALAERGPSGGRLALPPERGGWARTHAEGVIADLRGSGYDIVGDLEELLPPPSAPGIGPSDVTAEEMLDASVVAITALLAELGEAQGISRRQPHADQAAGRSATPHRPSALKQRLVALSDRHPVLHRARRGYWHLANAARHLRSAARPGPSHGGD